MGFSQKGGIESLSRAGARTGATLAADASADPLIAKTPDNSIGVETVKAINASLASTALPEMEKVYVYRIENLGLSGTKDWGPTGPGACSAFCMEFAFNPGSDEFNLAPVSGTWPVDFREACAPYPDRLGVLIDAEFNFLTGLVGSAPIDMQASTVLQLEPTADC